MNATNTEHIAIVTRAASGIGYGIALAFHATGARVVLADMRQDALDQAHETFDDVDRLAFIQVDVRDAEAVARLITETERTFGSPTAMIANAGIVPNVSVLNMDVSKWDMTLETNLRGVFLCCQAAARSMVANRVQGRIVTMSSIASTFGRLGASAYCASKAGVVMFTKVLAMELAEHGITVNSISPGVIEIPQRAQLGSSAFGDALIKAIPARRRGTPAEVADAVMYLCSDGARYISGAVLPVDGGSSTGWTHMPYSSPQR